MSKGGYFVLVKLRDYCSYDGVIFGQTLLENCVELTFQLTSVLVSCYSL